MLLGCNVPLDGACPVYQYIHGVVYDTHVKKVTTRSGSTYQMVVSYHYHNNESCIYVPASYYKYDESADRLAKSYAIGSTKELLLRRNLHTCMEIKDAHDTWITGMVFMVLTGAILLSVVVMMWINNEFTLSCLVRCFGGSFGTNRSEPVPTEPDPVPADAQLRLPNISIAKSQQATAVPISEVEIELT